MQLTYFCGTQKSIRYLNRIKILDNKKPRKRNKKRNWNSTKSTTKSDNLWSYSFLWRYCLCDCSDARAPQLRALVKCLLAACCHTPRYSPHFTSLCLTAANYLVYYLWNSFVSWLASFCCWVQVCAELQSWHGLSLSKDFYHLSMKHTSILGFIYLQSYYKFCY